MQTDLVVNQQLEDFVFELYSVQTAVTGVMTARIERFQALVTARWVEGLSRYSFPHAEIDRTDEERAKDSIAELLLKGDMDSAVKLFWEKAEAGYFGFPYYRIFVQLELEERAFKSLCKEEPVFEAFQVFQQIRPNYMMPPFSSLLGTAQEVFHAELVRHYLLTDNWTHEGLNGKKLQHSMRPVVKNKYFSDEESLELTKIISAKWWLENAGFFDVQEMMPSLLVGKSAVEIEKYYRLLVNRVTPYLSEKIARFEKCFGLPSIKGTEESISSARSIRFRLIMKGSITPSILEMTSANSIIERSQKKISRRSRHGF